MIERVLRSRGFRLAGFVAIPLLNAIVPLFLFPAVTANLHAAGWAAFAVGQSVGLAASVLVELGWGLNGPQSIAVADVSRREWMLAEAAASKLVVLAVVGPGAGLVGALVGRTDRLGCAVIAIGYTAAGLVQSWYFIGLSLPWMALATDSLVRLVFTLAAVALVNHGATLVIVGILLLASSLVSQGVAMLVVAKGRRPPRVGLSVALEAIRHQASAVVGRGMSSLYTALPITLVGIVSPSSVAVFASVERLMRMGLTGLQAVPNSMQGGFALRYSKAVSGSRSRIAGGAVLANCVLGLLGAVVLTLLGPWVASILYSGVVVPSRELFLVAGFVVLITCTSRATGGLVLVAEDRIRIIAQSAAVGAVVGVLFILIGAAFLGASGGYIGEICAELSVLVVQAFGLKGVSRGGARA